MSEDVSGEMLHHEYVAKRRAVQNALKELRAKFKVVKDERFTQLSPNGIQILKDQEELLISELTHLYQRWDLQQKKARRIP